MISSRDDFKTYIKQQLGEPVITVNVANVQIEQQIDNALQKFQKDHFDGWCFDIYELETIVDVSEYILPSYVFKVIDTLYGASSVGNIYEEILVSPWDYFYARGYAGHMDLTSFRILQEKIQNTRISLNTKIKFTFQESTHRLKIFPTPASTTIIPFVIHSINDPYDFPEIWDNEWLKEYATALVGLQWGQNLNKFSGTPLPGGAQINAQSILDYNKGEKDRLEQLLIDKYTEPVEPQFA